MAKKKAQTRWTLGGPALILQAAVATITLRDISQRTDLQIRGPRRLWQVAVTANSAGAAAYWIIGRRR